MRGAVAGPADFVEALERAGVRLLDGVTGLRAQAASGGLHLGGVEFQRHAGVR